MNIVRRSTDNRPSGKQLGLRKAGSSAEISMFDSQRDSKQENENDMREIENYIECQQQFDGHYEARLARVGGLGLEFIIDKYCMSAIKLNSLQLAHKGRE